MVNIVNDYIILTEKVFNTGQYQTKIKYEQSSVVVEAYTDDYDATLGHARWVYQIIGGSLNSKRPFYNPYKHQWQLFL